MALGSRRGGEGVAACRYILTDVQENCSDPEGGGITCYETSETVYQWTWRNIPEFLVKSRVVTYLDLG